MLEGAVFGVGRGGWRVSQISGRLESRPNTYQPLSGPDAAEWPAVLAEPLIPILAILGATGTWGGGLGQWIFTINLEALG